MSKEIKSTELVTQEQEAIAESTIDIRSMIHIVRGHQVMMDYDLAFLYQVETKRLNERVKRNSNRFPESFCFQLTREEFNDLRSQNATSSEEYGGRRYLTLPETLPKSLPSVRCRSVLTKAVPGS